MKNLKYVLTAAATAAALAGCGGGGGSGGESQGQYQITLRADKTTLPVNTGGYPVGIGAYAMYTTSLYVQATESGHAIPGGEDDIFGCNVAGGLDSGVLYYLDGDDDHQDDDGNPLAYRSITLGSNSGGNSFHFHAGSRAGTATITCSVTDPRDKKTYSASVNITVGASSSQAASILAITQAPGYLGTQNNLNDISNNVVVQARVMDDANQPVPTPSTPNLQVRIRPGDAANGARLLEGGNSGTVLQMRTIGGVGQFSLASGATPGPIVLEMTTDRADNNVANGIQDPITTLTQVYSVDEISAFPLTIEDTDWDDITNGIEYTHSLEAAGGKPPYEWTVTGLPPGLTADKTGIISGTPNATKDAYQVGLTVKDANNRTATMTKVVRVERGITPEDFEIPGCTANAACEIGPATVGSNFAFAFSASVPGVTWELSGLPGWLQGGSTGNSGFISGTPGQDDCGTHQFLVTVSKGATAVLRRAQITVRGGSNDPASSLSCTP